MISKEAILKLYNDFTSESDIGNKIKIRNSIKELIHSEREGITSFGYYILGLTKYDLLDLNIDNDIDETIKAHKLFQSALSIDNNYYMARLYSAHCYHDLKDYINALNEYLKVDSVKLKSNFPIWRFVKLQEQIGFCYYKTGNQGKAVEYFKDVLNYYKTINYDDLVNPSEIFECLDDNHVITKELRDIIGRS